ncbi:hypothetical protein QO002_005817 [Pararhizobium capsulatum DSM 1112]|uniref:Uncharacterized protein n=1 Tax=Pararhizobium capsulatum DSM 1112 TaxID=1121113 RepID=A0ABU0BZB8_9HYPH|nr:hypothetical protein [Pararhizobium capsulatum]MDQ0323611.1 hypothetical protein [Pararhizobium capsulatum DSM 1112]
MKIRILTLMAPFVVASVAILTPAESSGADQWFMLGEQTIKSADPSVNINSEGNRWEKDVKSVKLSAEGADVEIEKVVLHWDNRRDDTVSDFGVLKSGGQTAAKNAPGRKGRLTGVSVQYKILNDAKTATLKIWGYD